MILYSTFFNTRMFAIKYTQVLRIRILCKISHLRWHLSWQGRDYSLGEIMKRFIILFLFVQAVSFGQWKTGAVKLGYFNPSATEGGFIIGFEGGYHIDKLLSWQWSLDWFHKNYVDKVLVSELNEFYPGAVGEINRLRATTNIHDFPLMVGMTARFPISNRSQFYVTGSIGAELLVINYRNFQNPMDDNFEAAFDFDWRAGIGASFALSPRSELFGEISYHESHPSWTYEDDEFYYPNSVLERSYDMSGLMTRIGIRFFY